MTFIDRIRRLLGGSAAERRTTAAPDPDRADEAGAAAEPPGERGMISCMDALTVINDFLDGELDDLSEDQVRAHFDVCKRCYPHLKLEESFRDALRRAAESREGAPPELRARILDVLGS